MRTVLIFVLAMVLSVPSWAEDGPPSIPSAPATTSVTKGRLLRAALEANAQHTAGVNGLLPRVARIAGRTCKRRVVNGLVIGASIGVIVGGAVARDGVAGVTVYASRFGRLGGISGLMSCRP